MDLDPKLITPVLIGALVVWGIVRRLRRTFGRQPVHLGRLWFRIGVLTLAGGLVVVASAWRDARTLEALIAGLACGAALGYLGLRHTQFEATPEGRFYTPHTYIGLTVSVLLIGRLLYRFLYVSYGAHALPGTNPSLAVGYQKSPMTLGIFGVLVGYYVLYYAGVLLKTRSSALPAPSPISPG